MCHEHYGCYYDEVKFFLNFNKSSTYTKEGKTVIKPIMFAMYLDPEDVDVLYTCTVLME